MEDYSLFQLPS